MPVAAAIHALIFLSLVSPNLAPRTAELARGAGSFGLLGGGGGGRRGSAGLEDTRERLQYMEIARAPSVTSVPTRPTRVAPALQVQQPVPTVAKPRETPRPVEQLEPVSPEITVPAEPAAPTIELALETGVGGGSGNDGSRGNGPGTGLGVGSGVGTGRGSGTGPGRGGGADAIHPPTPDFTPIPPWPVPAKLKGQSVVLLFTVDQNGRTVKLEFQPTRDGSYNRKIRETYAEARFRPAVRADGTPVVAVAKIELTL